MFPSGRSYRAQILLETKADLSLELDLMDDLVREHLKSYQVWSVASNLIIYISAYHALNMSGNTAGR